MSPAHKPAARKPAVRQASASASKREPLRRKTLARDDHGEELLGRAERIVTLALGRGADEAECYLESGASVDVELEAGRIANTATSIGQGAGLRIVKDGRVGFAYLTRDEQAKEAAEQAIRQARHAPKRGFHLPSGGKAKPLAGRWHDDVAALDVQDAIDLALGLLKAAKAEAPKATVSGGGASLGTGWMAIANSAGVAAWDRSTSSGCSISLTLADGERAISAGESQTRHDLKVDPSEVTAKAAETALSLRKPKAPGKSRSCHVLLRPEAAIELVVGLAVSAATGDDARRGKTVWSDKLGKSVGPTHVSLVDDSRVPHAIGGDPFDDEGTPTRRLPIVQGGILRNFLYDGWDAHRHGATTTASASRPGFKSRPETGTHHVVLSSSKARVLDKLVAGIDDGYLVDSVLGAHTANPTTSDFSVTSPNVWRIAKGAIAGPVTEIAIAGNLPTMLAGLESVSTEVKRMDGAQMPALLVRDVSVSM